MFESARPAKRSSKRIPHKHSKSKILSALTPFFPSSLLDTVSADRQGIPLLQHSPPRLAVKSTDFYFSILASSSRHSLALLLIRRHIYNEAHLAAITIRAFLTTRMWGDLVASAARL
ncbi:hypothetical protein K432DRAFT_387048 [Lepidopterella palustris CBS 459.81]|uniref:Uncharacterized protein n=1 Tax=Lepidopterella palustris CBS 459.81 TaxID=1314670 RepID=A0A8E2J987_9PEZI|nr:hypothetical protein K432DRAFT_387048 [Lepidopterella palustris CBS 459.81]